MHLMKLATGKSLLSDVWQGQAKQTGLPCATVVSLPLGALELVVGAEGGWGKGGGICGMDLLGTSWICH